MGYTAYNTVPIGRFREYCDLSTVCLMVHGYSGEIRLEYLHLDGSKTESCIDIDEVGIDIDISEADLLKITR